MGPGIEIIGEDNTGIEISDCQFINCGTFALTKNYNYNVAGNGKHIANLVKQTHTVTSKGNKFFPESNISLDVDFLD